MNQNTLRRRRLTQQLRNRHIRQQRKRWEDIKHNHSKNSSFDI